MGAYRILKRHSVSNEANGALGVHHRFGEDAV